MKTLNPKQFKIYHENLVKEIWCSVTLSSTDKFLEFCKYVQHTPTFKEGLGFNNYEKFTEIIWDILKKSKKDEVDKFLNDQEEFQNDWKELNF